MNLSNQKPVAYIEEENKTLRVLLCGLNSAGKTTVHYSTKLDKSIPMTPKFGLDMEIVAINNISMQVWNYGGRTTGRVIPWTFYRRTEGLIFVVDSNDRKRIDEARKELHRMSNEEESRNKPFLILANKQDLSSAMTLDELRDKLNLGKLDANVKWRLQPTCAIHNEGIHEGLKWLANSIVEKVDPMKPIVETFNDTTKMQNYLRSILNMTNLKTFVDGATATTELIEENFTPILSEWFGETESTCIEYRSTETIVVEIASFSSVIPTML